LYGFGDFPMLSTIGPLRASTRRISRNAAHGQGTSRAGSRTRSRVSFPAACAPHQVSTHGRFLPVRALVGGNERKPAMTQERVSAGSMTSSISNKVAALSALPRS
jgi:hypothetical protein